MTTTNILSPGVTQALARLEITKLTPIQEEVFEHWQGSNDIVGLAATGSGKTLAFALSTLAHIKPHDFHTQVLVLCPTRELALQVAQEFRRATQLLENVHTVTLIGGESVGHQINALKGACHIVVGTPGRTKDHLQKRRLQLDRVHTRILDEADRMLEMGMVEDVEEIFSATPKECRTGFFSATYSEAVSALATQWLRQPVKIDVRESTQAPAITQQIYTVDQANKTNALSALLATEQAQKVIVFCQTRINTQALCEQLANKGFAVVGLQGDMDQYERQRALMKFSLGAANVLVATDVAARGLDLPKVDYVISYDLSESQDTHLHRIGRTGRAGASGIAVIFADPSEIGRANSYCTVEENAKARGVQHLRFHQNRIVLPEYQSIEVRAGKKDKLRKGDIIGALIKEADVPADDIGTIVLTPTTTFIAVKTRSVKKTLRHFKEGKIKGRRYRANKF